MHASGGQSVVEARRGGRLSLRSAVDESLIGADASTTSTTTSVKGSKPRRRMSFNDLRR